VTAHDYRFCIHGEDFGNGDCSFVTYQQCRASASGRLAYCEVDVAMSNVVPINRTHPRHH
jgi:hypothetical protein